MRRLLSLFLALVCALSLTGCTEGEKYEYCELMLLLDTDFKSADPEGAFELTLADGKQVSVALSTGALTDAAFTNGDIAVAIRRISFAAALEGGIPDTLSQRQLAAYYMKESGVGGEIFTSGDAPYYKYKKTDSDGNEFLFTVSCYRSKYAYFTVTYLCGADREDTLLPEITEYIGSAGFTQ